MVKHRLGILAVYIHKNRLEELSYFRQLAIYGKQLGIDVEVFTPEDVQPSKKVKVRVYEPKTKTWTRKTSTIPSLIYDRCRYHGASTYRLLKAFRQKYRNFTYMSKPLTNKWRMHQLLATQNHIARHLPITKKYENAEQLITFLKKYRVVFAKPKNGTGGRGILRIQQLSANHYRVEGRNSHRQILPVQEYNKKQFIQHVAGLGIDENYILQKAIASQLENGRVYDFRLLIQKNKDGEWSVTGCAGRVGPKRSITSNLHGGGTAIPMDHLLLSRFSSKDKVMQIKQQIDKFAHDIAHYLEQKFGVLCELGIDIAIDSVGKYWLLEVNPKPSRDVFRRIGSIKTYRNAIKRPLEFAKWILEQDKKALVSFMPEPELQ